MPITLNNNSLYKYHKIFLISSNNTDAASSLVIKGIFFLFTFLLDFFGWGYTTGSEYVTTDSLEHVL